MSFRMERMQRDYPGLAIPPDTFLWAWGPAFPLTGSYPFSCSPTPLLSSPFSPALSVLQASLTAGQPTPGTHCAFSSFGSTCAWADSVRGCPQGLVAFPHQVPAGGLCLSCLIDPLVPASVLDTTAQIALVNTKKKTPAGCGSGRLGPSPRHSLLTLN